MKNDISDIKAISQAYTDMVENRLSESNNLVGKGYTFVATTRSRTDARKKAAEYPNAKVVQLDDNNFGIIVPRK